MQAQYRSDYPGEFLVVQTRWAQGSKQQKREWIANPIENQHISGRAACLATGVDKDFFDHTRLQRHRGGLLSSKKLQTYGTGAMAKEMRLDFAVESNADMLGDLMDSNYHDKNIVYTTSRNCIANPEKFYIVPYRPYFFDQALIVYLAAFDQHNEIFLLGYNKEVFAAAPDWHKQLDQIFSAYASTKFFIVGEKTNMFDSWFDHANVSNLSHREFVIYCDV